jgi:hypothetical protein
VVFKFTGGRENTTWNDGSDIQHKQRESESDAVCSKMWLHAVPLFGYASNACQILNYEFAYAPKARYPQKPIVMNLHKTKGKLVSLYWFETECEKA